MSNSAIPVDTRSVDGEKVKSYSFPSDGDPVFDLDTSEEGYTVEWRVSNRYRADLHEEFLRGLGDNRQVDEETALEGWASASDLPENLRPMHSRQRIRAHLSGIGNRSAEITIGEVNSRGTFDEVTSLNEFPSNCTYLRVEAGSFDLEWEVWDDYNRVMLSAPGNDSHLMHELFDQCAEEYVPMPFSSSDYSPSDYEQGLDEVMRTIESDCDPYVLE
jgi:hypothetical protein